MLTNGVKGMVQFVFVVTTSFLVALLYLSFATVTSKVAPGAKVLKQIIPSSSLVLDNTGPPFCEKKKVTPVTVELVGTSVTLTQTV